MRPQGHRARTEAFTRATFVVEDRVAGLQQTADNPLPAAEVARHSRRSDEQVIADTIREETHAGD